MRRSVNCPLCKTVILLRETESGYIICQGCGSAIHINNFLGVDYDYPEL